MHLEIGVVAVGLSREQRLQLQSLGLGEQRFERRDAFFLGRLVALRLAELDKRQGVVELALELLLRAEPLLELATLAHDLLRVLGVVPEIGVFDARVQLAETTCRRIDVKDASSKQSHGLLDLFFQRQRFSAHRFLPEWASDYRILRMPRLDVKRRKLAWSAGSR